MKAAGLILVLVLVGPIHAVQKVEQQTTRAKGNAKKRTGAPGAEAEGKVQRDKARSLLVSLSTDARTFRDQRLRARSLARIADALWAADTAEARLLFRKAWEAAEVSDQESERKVQEEIQQLKARSEGGGYAYHTPSSVRREVLRLAARHDRLLSEEFLEKLRAQKQEAANAADQSLNQQNEALSQRLGVARELLQNGDVEKAVQFADPVLTTATMETVDFLSDLREKNAAFADSRYTVLLVSAGNHPQSDANTASILSSYIFTPHLFITFSGDGTSSSQRSSTVVPADVSAELRAAFFQSAASILLRPLPVPGQPDQSTSGLEGKYLVIKRLLPLFEQSATGEIVDALRGQLNALTTLVSEGTRKRDDEWVNKGVKPDRPAADREQSILDRIERAKTSAERDSGYVQLAFMTSSQGDMRARDFVSKIEESELRKQAQAYIDGTLASFFMQKKMTDQALELSSKGELTHLQRTWVLTECAKLLLKTDRDKALELVDQAATEARRIDGSDPNLPRALNAVANAVKVVDVTRVWDALFDAVKAANSVEGFTGEDGMLMLRFQSKGQNSASSNTVAEFDVEGIFRELATEDYDRAVELARGFQGEGPRAVATIAIARGVLDPKKKNPPLKN